MPMKIAIPAGPSSSVTETFPPAPGGMNVAVPANELDDTQARILQDILVDYPGLARRRGPMVAASGVAAMTRMGTGIAMTLNPQGIDRYAVLNGDSGNGYFSVLSADMSTWTDLAWPHPLPTSPQTSKALAYRIYDAQAAILGGAMVGVSSAYDANAPNEALAYWRGGINANYATGTLTVARGSAAVAGAGTAWVANASPGMHLFATTDNRVIAIPTAVVPTPSTAGGTLAANTYFYRVTALNGAGETTGSVEVTATTTGATGSVALVWAAVAGATSYRIYRGTAAGAENVFYTSAVASFTDTGAASTGGTVPVSNTATVAGFTQTLIGTVLQVNSDTSITLDKASPYPITGKAYTLQSIRGVYPRVTVGRITCDINSMVINGGDTKFRSQGLGTGNWNLYRESDFVWIGEVASVASETSITLMANAAVAVADEAYVALRADADWSLTITGNTQKPGFLTASYAELQWYANNGQQFDHTYRVWFSDSSHPEALDMTDDGNWIPVSSSGEVQESIRAIGAAYNSLVVMKENETFAIIGSSPATFAVKKIEDDGTLGGMSVQQFGGGVIWAGRQGIHYYDGIQPVDLVADKLGAVYKNSIRTFDPSRYRLNSMMVRNHYYLWVENIAPTLAIVKGNVSTTPSSWGIAINMETRAVTMMTNLHIRGSVVLPASTGRTVWYLANDATHGYVCDANALFDSEGIDAFAADGGTAGPDFFYESKKFDAGDGMRLKKFKELAANYLAQGGNLNIDVVLGLNDIGQTLTSSFPSSVYTWNTLRQSFATWTALKTSYPTWLQVIQGVFQPKRVRFSKASEFLSFRLYQSSSAMTRVRIGPYKIGYKLMRNMRV